jgi:hypothetical protein
MDKIKNTPKTPERKHNITTSRPCYDCGEPAEAFHWAPAHWIFCVSCSPHQKGMIELKRLQDLREAGITVKLWGE